MTFIIGISFNFIAKETINKQNEIRSNGTYAV